MSSHEISPQPVPPLHDAEAWVLAGGRSTRMGRDKALLPFSPFSGRPLLTIALDKLRSLRLAPVATPRIAGSRPDLASYAPVVEDLHLGCGPLSGMEAALAATTQPLNLFLPVDQPFVPARFLAWMLDRAAATGALATYPRLGGLGQPLCGVYHRDLLPQIARSLRAGEYAIMRAIDTATREVADREAGNSTSATDFFSVELVAAAFPEMHAFSPVPLHRWFENCNSPEDLAALQREPSLI